MINGSEDFLNSFNFIFMGPNSSRTLEIYSILRDLIFVHPVNVFMTSLLEKLWRDSGVSENNYHFMILCSWMLAWKVTEAKKSFLAQLFNHIIVPWRKVTFANNNLLEYQIEATFKNKWATGSNRVFDTKSDFCHWVRLRNIFVSARRPSVEIVSLYLSSYLLLWLKMGLGRIVLGTLAEYGTKTTIGGLCNAGLTSSKPRQIYWLIIFFSLFGYTVKLLIDNISQYLAYEVITSTDLSYSSTLNFPAVTICNQNRSVYDGIIWKRP